MNLKSKINKQMHKTAHIPFFRGRKDGGIKRWTTKGLIEKWEKRENT